MRFRRTLAEPEEPIELNLIPLIDVIMFLLIFFISTTSFLEMPGVSVDKPQAASARQVEKTSIIFAVTSDGKVGIGTSSPGTSLDVNGTVRSTALVSVANVTTHEQGAWLEWNKPGSDGVTYLLNQKGGGSGGIVFGEVSTANAITERMRIAHTGYVGIGTSAPSAPLHVTTTASVASRIHARC